jgi:hypothetical protein
MLRRRFDEPRRLLPFANFVISMITTTIVFASWGFFCNKGWRVPQYLIDAPITKTFASTSVKNLQLVTIAIGSVNAGGLLLDILLYFSPLMNGPKTDNLWPSNRFVEKLTDWSSALLYVISILIAPIVLYNVPDDEYKAVYALGFSTLKNTAITAAAAMAVSDIVDRRADEYILSIATTATFAVGEIVYFFATMSDRTPAAQNMLMGGKVMGALGMIVLYYRIFKYGYGIIRSFWKTGELRLRGLSMKEWRFVVNTQIFVVGSLLIFFLVGVENFDYWNTKESDEAVYYLSFIIGGAFLALLPVIFTRYEAALANVSCHSSSCI